MLNWSSGRAISGGSIERMENGKGALRRDLEKSALVLVVDRQGIYPVKITIRRLY